MLTEVCKAKRVLTPQLFYYNTLDALAPADNFYRHLNKNIGQNPTGVLFASSFLILKSSAFEAINVFRSILLKRFLSNSSSEKATYVGTILFRMLLASILFFQLE